MTGGGGGEVVVDPVGVEVITGVLKDAREVLIDFFTWKKLDAGFPFLSLYGEGLDPRFLPILESLKEKDIQNLTTKACMDENGIPRDGYSNANDGNSICISSYNLGNKLAIENFRSRTYGLVAHEYAHWAGYEEEDANKVQEYVRKQMGPASYAESNRLPEPPSSESQISLPNCTIEYQISASSETFEERAQAINAGLSLKYWTPAVEDADAFVRYNFFLVSSQSLGRSALKDWHGVEADRFREVWAVQATLSLLSGKQYVTEPHYFTKINYTDLDYGQLRQAAAENNAAILRAFEASTAKFPICVKSEN